MTACARFTCGGLEIKQDSMQTTHKKVKFRLHEEELVYNTIDAGI